MEEEAPLTAYVSVHTSPPPNPHHRGTQYQAVHLTELIPEVTFQPESPPIPFMNKNSASCDSIQAFYKKFIHSLEISTILHPPSQPQANPTQPTVLPPPLPLSLLDKLKCAPGGWLVVNRESIYPFHPVLERTARAFKDSRQQCEWHQVILLACSHLADRIVLSVQIGGPVKPLSLSRPYLMIDGSMARANLPFLNNLCCYRDGQLAYNRSCYFYIDWRDQYFKDSRWSLMNFLTRSLGYKTIVWCCLLTPVKMRGKYTGLPLEFKLGHWKGLTSIIWT